MYVTVQLCTRIAVEKCTTEQAVNVVVFGCSFALEYAWIVMPLKTNQKTNGRQPISLFLFFFCFFFSFKFNYDFRLVIYVSI